MNDDTKKERDELPEDLYRYASSTDCILRAISNLSKKIDDTQKESEEKERVRFAVTITVAVLSFLAGAVAAITGVLTLIG